MLTLQELVTRITPSKVVLFLGAGASIPSGAPSGAKLANDLSLSLTGSDSDSNDLMEISGILAVRYGRRELVAAVRKILGGCKPVGMINDLPLYDWGALYTTNFDTLVEQVFARARKPIVPIVSNFDYGKTELSDGLKYFKLHGTLDQDEVDGYPARMVLTERDYEEYKSFRQTLFNTLKLDLSIKDVLIIGYSLSDPHLRRALQEAATIKRDEGAPGRIFLLIFKEDPDRARMWEDRGFYVSFGSIDDFMQALASHSTNTATIQISSQDDYISGNLRAKTLVVSEQSSLNPSARDLFNGRAATYADIKGGLTFERQLEETVLNGITSGSDKFFSIIGTAGVGKTTMARRILFSLCEKGWNAWEHKSDHPIRADDWLNINELLKSRSQHGVLLLDECTPFLGQVNRLFDKIAVDPNSRLSVILTAARASWTPRVKSPSLYEKGKEISLTELTNRDINELIRIVNSSDQIQRLVSSEFLRLENQSKFERLRQRCGADMFVCLKNIFATEGLDTILLREFASLDPHHKEIYSGVCALQAAAEHVHRQLVLRLLPISTPRIPSLLEELEGLVNEYDIDARNGLFGWSTRHKIIAEIITSYEYSDQNLIYDLLKRTVQSLVPTVPTELMAIRALCNSDFGINRLNDVDKRIELYRLLISSAPSERIPHHRLISTLLQLEDLESVDYAIRQAEEDVGEDRPIARYKVRLLLLRATKTAGILKEHRIAMLKNAEAEALKKVERYPLDKHQYRVYGEVGVAFAEVAQDLRVLDDALNRMREASGKILEPDMLRFLERLQGERKRFRK